MSDSKPSPPRRRRRAPAHQSGPPDESLSRLEALIHAATAEIESLREAAKHAALTDELALALLQRRDLHSSVLEDLAKNSRVLKSRDVRLALVVHQRAPRHVALPIIRQLFTFELMQIALNPQVPADIKLAADEALVSRVESISAGERVTLARRGSSRVVAALLNDEDPRVVEAGLNNPYLTEIWITKAVLKDRCVPHLVHQVCHHPKWSLRKDVRGALLRNAFTPLASAIRFSQSFPLPHLRELLDQSDLPINVTTYLLQLAEKRRH